MRADADFMVYVGARWPGLVREAVLLGVPPDQAADATVDALSRCRRDWGRASREEDVDALVRRELGAAAGRRRRTGTDTREQAAQELLVLAPPTLEDVRHREAENRRAVRRHVVRVAVPLLVVAAVVGGYLAATGGGGEPTRSGGRLGNAATAREENPAPGVVWYADGQLHLAHTVLAVEGLRDMTRLGSGVLYGDDQGRVVYAADDGSRAVLGHTGTGSPVVASDENGWAAWVDTAGEGSAIVVEEAQTGNRLVRFPVDPDARVVAVDGDAVYFVEARGAYYLVPEPPDAVPVLPAGLLDVRARTRVFQTDPTHLTVVQSLFDSQVAVAGEGAVLAPDGDLLVTRRPDDSVAVYDPRSGADLDNGLSATDHVVAVMPGARLTISYVVAPDEPTPGRELELRTCQLSQRLAPQCVTAARIPNQGGAAVLAR